MKISKVILYDEPAVPEIQLERLGNFLREEFPVEIEIREDFFHCSSRKIYQKIAETRIFDLKKPFQKNNFNTSTEIENVNKDKLDNQEKTLYDGFEFHNVLSEFIPVDENNIDIFHVIFTDKITCTFDENDFRYHSRALIGCNPAIISTTGMIEAPAKPKQYYLDLMTNFYQEKIEDIKKKYKGQFLEYHDPRISEIAEGYLLQAIIYFETGEEFCDNKDCRLFNFHWQEDLLFSQLENKRFCKKHLKILEKLKQSNSK